MNLALPPTDVWVELQMTDALFDRIEHLAATLAAENRLNSSTMIQAQWGVASGLEVLDDSTAMEVFECGMCLRASASPINARNLSGRPAQALKAMVLWNSIEEFRSQFRCKNGSVCDIIHTSIDVMLWGFDWDEEKMIREAHEKQLRHAIGAHFQHQKLPPFRTPYFDGFTPEPMRIFNDKKDHPMHPQTTPTIPPELTNALQQAKHIVVFTGAGVSAESGIPTFRDALTGLWSNFDPEELATADAFRKDNALVWGWYEWRRMKVLNASPNPAHIAIAELAKKVPKLTVVTQNVDDLHERAGSVDVIHLHGSLHAPRCYACGRSHYLAPGTPQEPEGGRRVSPPNCTHCGGPVRPGVVWFSENLPEVELRRAFAAARDCDLLLAIGTSGVVYPAARIPGVAREAGAKVVQVNPASTDLDQECDWTLHGTAGEVMPQLLGMILLQK